MNYSNEQLAAIYSNDKQICVVASAGSGKTSVLTARIKRLLDEGVSPETIYAITYTNNAAEEMKSRLNNTKLHIGTIHSLANRILMSNNINTDSALSNEAFDELFDMIKHHSVKMPHITHLLVDEFQDINEAEFEFVTLLGAENLFVVGDSAQNIYEWKGSDYMFFEQLLRDKKTTLFTLTNNYRNPANIIKFGEDFLARITGIYRIHANACSKRQGNIDLDDFSYDALIQRVECIGDYANWFILCRTNAEVSSTIVALKRCNIPCVTFKQSEYTLEEIRDMMESDSVKVLTIHSSKGLEAKHVAVIDKFANWSDGDRRLRYVAATRAAQDLIWLKGSTTKAKAPKKKARRGTFEEDMIDFGGFDGF